jgi:magnesium transporter
MEISSYSKTSTKTIVNCVAYSHGRRKADVALSQVHEFLKESNQFLWIGLHEPSEEVLEQVQHEFGLHDLAVEDAHNAHQRPKVEMYEDSIFVVLAYSANKQGKTY